ncbi:hypothetical protein F5Y13DRAFT_174737 [Hypoxylon sp. FL1857]|nr:hypothetical protein F5Y13DRAFT_174737 [Hypoxylon sp. FL1857]
METENNPPQQVSHHSSTVHTQSYEDELNMDEPLGSQDPAPLASPSTADMRRRARMEIMRSLRPTSETALSRSSQTRGPGSRPSVEQHESTTISIASLNRATPTCRSWRRYAYRRQNNDTSEAMESGTTRSRPRRYAKYLTASRIYADYERPRCPKCRWTLLAKPFGAPNVPVIAVTDPQGKVMYPYDHTYYPNDPAADEEDGADVWD